MENKLDVLTRKLYEEGLSKGKSEAETLVANANKQAKDIVSEAEAKAQAILKAAEAKAEEVKKNAETELMLAGRQSVSVLKQQIENMIIAEGIDKSVKDANMDPAFVKDLLLSVASNWNGSQSGKTELQALLPKDKEAQLGEEIKKMVSGSLNTGFEVGFSEDVKSGFRIGPKDGSYYISFGDGDFKALLNEYLRPQVSNLLFGEK